MSASISTVAGAADAAELHGWRRTWSRFRRQPTAMAGLVVAVVMGLAGLLGGYGMRG